jgi:hypothetical protein
MFILRFLFIVLLEEPDHTAYVRANVKQRTHDSDDVLAIQRDFIGHA